MTGSRRPLTSRDAGWARALAAHFAASSVTPNQISAASVGFAAAGCAMFALVPHAGPVAQPVLLILAAVMLQLRLLCNLLDGMVAIEGGKASPTGAFWNEAPDRAADVLFFCGAGLAAGLPELGLGCAVLAVATAYLRELGRSEGFAADFCGPMAKQHRMAALTVGCLLAALLPVKASAAAILTAALSLILAGTALTVYRRARRLLVALGAR